MRTELSHGADYGWCPGTIVLEELEHAQARGAPILAEYVGGSFTCDAHHMTEPSPDGAGVKLCLERCARYELPGKYFSKLPMKVRPCRCKTH